MKIRNDADQVADREQVLIALRDLIGQPTDTQVRPCPNCHVSIVVESTSSTSSAASCSSQCQYASRMMSSEPEKFPIEEAIAPLVYALYTLRLLTPCWSCEGHLGADGKIGKLPKVWFYCASGFYPRMIAQVIGNLQAHHKIGYSWMVRVLPFSQSTLSTTYSIEAGPSDASLATLQKDVVVLGQQIRLQTLSLARDYLKK
ncbi:MAG: hypothetical protein ACI9SB_002905 [Candidatus Azotimanducaceae bacterium]|jgi:hypothetical protein